MPDWLQSLPPFYCYAAIFLVVFLNNLCFPLPGTTLLLAAGFLVGRGGLSFGGTVGIGAAACFLGTTGGYGIGRKYGRPLLEKIRWLRLTHLRLRHMEHFFRRYGAKGVFFARFVAFFHPLLGLLAGIGKAPVRPFLFYNFAGSTCYALVYILLGKYLGQRWGFHKLWAFQTVFFIVLLTIALLGLRLFWRHSIYTFFGYPVYKRKRGGFWGA